jgi:Mn-dependent DtxR family transcriptional regulator
MIRDCDYLVRAQYGDLTAIVQVERYGRMRLTMYGAKELARRIIRSKLWALEHGAEWIQIDKEEFDT